MKRKANAAAEPDVPAARAALLSWYDRHARDLPWRRTRDPYAIWVSEIMLQQTRVETVIPYYSRFLRRFPTPCALADAPLDDVLAHWSGLGYYRRARLLHAGAKAVVEAHGGAVPRTHEARRALPGVGRYTAGAIGSIAFDLPEPIVDGNVARVLSRLACIDTPLGTRETERVLWEQAEQFSQGERPGALNQALMELGACVCLPQTARCDVCPLASLCRARRAGRVRELPVPAAKKAPRTLRLVALLASDAKGRIFLQRGEGSLFGGLWGVPMREGEGKEAVQELAQELGLSGPLDDEERGRVKHVLTHRVFQLQVFAMRNARSHKREDLRALSEDERGKLGIASLTKKVIGLTAFARGSARAQLVLSQKLDEPPKRRRRQLERSR
jgi:A/G-specific adenine glycosylase